LGDHEIIVIKSAPDQQQVLRLGNAVSAKFDNQRGR
jgi:hypothetical protein